MSAFCSGGSKGRVRQGPNEQQPAARCRQQHKETEEEGGTGGHSEHLGTRCVLPSSHAEIGLRIQVYVGFLGPTQSWTFHLKHFTRLSLQSRRLAFGLAPLTVFKTHSYHPHSFTFIPVILYNRVLIFVNKFITKKYTRAFHGLSEDKVHFIKKFTEYLPR